MCIRATAAFVTVLLLMVSAANAELAAVTSGGVA